jgi:hypothetical protein
MLFRVVFNGGQYVFLKSATVESFLNRTEFDKIAKYKLKNYFDICTKSDLFLPVPKAQILYSKVR